MAWPNFLSGTSRLHGCTLSGEPGDDGREGVVMMMSTMAVVTCYSEGEREGENQSVTATARSLFVRVEVSMVACE
jgi:hypothetical protein